MIKSISKDDKGDVFLIEESDAGVRLSVRTEEGSACAIFPHYDARAIANAILVILGG